MNKKTWKILESQNVFVTPFWKARRDVCETLQGHKIEYYSIERPNAVSIAAFTKDRKLILEHHYRHPQGQWFIELPAGMLEEHETKEEGVVREFLEETGYRVEQPLFLRTFSFTPGLLKQEVSLFVGFNAQKMQESTQEAGEEIEVFLRDFDEVLQLIDQGEICDVDAIAELYIVKRYLDIHGFPVG